MKLKRFLAFTLSIMIMLNSTVPAFATETQSETEVISMEDSIDAIAEDIVEQYAVTSLSNNSIDEQTIEETDDVLTGQCGDNVTWTLNSEGLLTLTGTGEIASAASKSYFTTEVKSQIKNVVFEEGITSVGSYMFNGCSNLSTVTLSDSITKIDDNAFSNLNALTSITFGSGLISIGNEAFYSCDELTEICFPATLSNLGDNAFKQCISLEKVTFGDCVLTEISSAAFSGCSALKTIDKFPATLKYIEQDAFSGCKVLMMELALPVGLISIGNNAFSNCSQLYGELLLPESLTNIGYNAFYGCSGFTGVLEIPNNVTNIGNSAFEKCSGFTGLILSEGLTIISQSSFADCTGLTGELIIPDKVTDIYIRSFSNCSNLDSIVFGTKIASINSAPGNSGAVSTSAYDGCTGIKTLMFTGATPPSLGSTNPFRDMVNLETVYVPAESFGTYSTRLRPNLPDTAKIYTDDSEEEFIITESGELIGYQGTGDTLVIPNEVISIGDYVFYNCNNLTGELLIPDNVISIGKGAFQNCGGLTSLKLSENLQTINENTFAGCSGLTGELVIPDSVTLLYCGAFADCNQLQSVTFGTGLNQIDYRISSASQGNYTFARCNGIESLIFKGNIPPKSVTDTNTSCNPWHDLVNLKTIYVNTDELIETYKTYYGDYLSENITFVTDIEASIPKNLHADYISSKRIIIAWDKMNTSQISGYIIYRDGKEIGRNTSTETNWEDTDIKVNTSYTYEICGYTNEDENVLYTQSISLEAMAQFPEVLQIFTNGCNTDTLAGNLTTLYAHVSNTGGFENSPVGSYQGTFWYEKNGERIFLGDASLTSINYDYGVFELKIDISEIPEAYYKFYFCYEDCEGTKTEKTEILFVNHTIPEKLTNVRAVNDTNQIVIRWDAPTSETFSKYIIYKKSAEATDFVLLSEISSGNIFNYIDTDVEMNQYYDYYVIVEDGYGLASEPSNIARGCPNADISVPMILSLTPKNESVLTKTEDISAAASDNIEVTRMELLISTDQGTTWEIVAESQEAQIHSKLDTTIYADGEIQIKSLAYDEEGNCSKGLVHTYFVDNTGPEKVTGLSYTSSSISATLYWDKISNDDYYFYRVEQLIGEEWVIISDVYRTLGTNLYGLSPDTEYIYRVTAYDEYMNRGITSDEITVKTTLDEEIPSITSLSPQGGRYSQSIPLTATAEDNYLIEKMQIQYSFDLDNWQEIETKTFEIPDRTNSMELLFDVSQMNEGSIYIRAIAWDISGNQTAIDESAPYIEVIVDRTAPAKPEIMSVENGDGYLEIRWNKGTEEDLAYYYVYRSEDGETFTNISGALASLNYIDRDVETEKTYYYKIYVTDFIGNASLFSEIINVTSEKDTTAPVIFSLGSTIGEKFSVNEKRLTIGTSVYDNRKLSSVSIYYKKTADSEYELLETFADINTAYYTAETSLDLEEVMDGESYYFKTDAVDNEGNVADSMEASCVADGTAPVISELTVTLGEERNAILSWKSGMEEDLAGYQIYRKTKSEDWKIVGSVGAQSETEEYSHVDYSIPAESGVYTYKVVAIDCVKNSTEYEAGSIICKDATYPDVSLNCENIMELGKEYFIDASASSDNGEIVKYEFDFGDGTVISGKKSEHKHTYQSVGNYQITLKVTDDEGNTSTLVQVITVRDKTTIGNLNVTVKDNSGRTLTNAPVYFDVGTPNQFVKYTDAFGKVSLTAGLGKHTIGCFMEGYLPVKKDVVLFAGEIYETILTVQKGDIVTGEFETRRMTLDEVIAAGIDIYGSTVKNFTKISFKFVDGINYHYFETICDWNGVFYGNKSFEISTSSGEERVFVPYAVYYSPDEENNDINDIQKKIEAVALLDLPARGIAKNEYFDVKLHIINNASEEFSLFDNTITLNVPAGLSIAKSNISSPTASVHFNEIKGQTTQTIEWILRGDYIGEYYISADFSGVLSEFNVPVSAHFEAKEPIEVYGFYRSRMKISIQKLLNTNKDYNYNLEYSNPTTEPVYCPDIILPEDDKALEIYYLSENGKKAITEFPEILQSGESIFMECESKGHFEYYELYEWFENMYGAYGIPIDFVIEKEQPTDEAIVFYSEKTGTLLKNVELTINDELFISDAEGCIYWKGEIPKELAIKCFGYSDYVVESEKILGDTGTHEVVLYNEDSTMTPRIISLHYKSSAEKGWINALRGAMFIYKDSKIEFEFDFNVDWKGHESGRFILEQGGEDKVSTSFSGVDKIVIQDRFEPEIPIYAYIISKDGTRSASRKVNINYKNEDNPFTKLHDFKFKLASDLEFTIPSGFPVVGGNKIKINLDDSPLYVETDHDSFRIGIGIKENLMDKESGEKKFELLKNYYKKMDKVTEAEEKYEIARKIFKESGNIKHEITSTSPVKFDCGFNGYVEGTITESGCVVTEGKMSFFIDISGSISEQVLYPPVFVTFSLGTKAGADGTITRFIPDSSFKFDTSIVISVEPYAKLTGGIGAKDIVAIELTGGLHGKLDWHLMEDYAIIKGWADANLKAYTGPFTFIDVPWKSEEKVFHDGSKKSEEEETSIEGYSSSEILYRVYDKANYFAVNEFNYTENWQETESTSKNEKVLQQKVYPDARQTLLVTDDIKMLVWLSQDSTRAAGDSTLIVYSVYNDREDTWSTPVPLDDDGTADLYPEAIVNGKDIYVVWQNTSKVFNTSEITLDDIGKFAEIRVAKYDSIVGEFTTYCNTLNREEEDGGPSAPFIISEDGIVVAIWTENSEYDIFGINGTNRILASKMTENGWSEPKIIAEKLPMLGSCHACIKDSTVRIACSRKINLSDFGDEVKIVNQDIATTADWEIYEYLWNADDSVIESRITENEVLDSHPYYGAENGKKVLYWNQESQLRTHYFTEEKEDASCKFAVGSSPTQITTDCGSYMFWISDSEINSSAKEIFCSVYDEDTETYGNPVAVTNSGKYITSFQAVAENDGSIIIIYQGRTITTDGNTTIYRDSGFYQISVIPEADLCIIDNGSLQKNNIQPGENVEFKITVKNQGMSLANGYFIQLIDESGKVVCTKLFNDTLHSGEVDEVVISYYLPSDFTGQQYTVRATLQSGKESDTDNNEFKINLEGTSLIVHSVQAVRNGNQVLFILKVENNGAVNMDIVTLNVYENSLTGNLLDSKTLNSINSGEYKTFTYSMNMEDINFSEDGIAKIYFEGICGDVSDYGAAVLYVNEKSPINIVVSEAKMTDEGISVLLYSENQSIQQKNVALMCTVLNSDGTIAEYTTLRTTLEAGRLQTYHLLIPITEIENDWSVKAGFSIPVENIELSNTTVELQTGESIQLTANILPEEANNKEYHWKSANELIASVTEDGQVIAKQAGTTIITCTADDGFGAKAQCTVTVSQHTAHVWSEWTTKLLPTCLVEGEKTRHCTVEGCSVKEEASIAKLTPTIKVNVTSIPLQVKQSTSKVKVSGLASGDKVVSWTSSNTNIAKVSSTGKITAQNKTGTATVTVKLASGKTAKVTVKVQKGAVKATKITGISSSVTLNKGKKLTLKPVISPITCLDKVTYKSSNTKVAKVSSKGIITAVGKGTATITVKASSGKTVKCKVTVKVPATKVKLSKSSVSINKGKKYTLKATMSPSSSTDKLKWSSSNTKVAKVSSKGIITAVGKGTATITVKTTSGKTAKCKVTVKVPATKVKLNKTSVSITKGKTYTLKATISPSSTTDKLKWSSSNTKVAKVSSKGVVTAVAKGTATITVKTTSGKTSTCKVKIK